MTEGEKEETYQTGTEKGQAGAAEKRATGWERDVGESELDVCDREPGERTERTQIPHRRSRQSWERDGARSAARGKRVFGEMEGRASGEALRVTQSPTYAPEAAMPRGAAHMPGSLRARGLVPGAGARRRPWARGRRGHRLRAAPAAALALPSDGQ